MTGYLKRNSAEEFREAVDKAKLIVILTHTNPDGDALGSVTAMSSYLKFRGKACRVVVPNPFPKNLAFMDKDRKILINNRHTDAVKDVFSRADLLIALDFNQLKRVDDVEPLIRNSNASKVLIDHHPDPENSAFDLVISNTEVSSTAELLFWLIRTLEGGSVKNLPAECAQALYVGMMTDTNNFANSVAAGTFKMSYELLDMGVDKETLQLKVFGGFSEGRMRLLGHSLLNKMKILHEFGAGYIILTREELEKFSFSEGDTEGFVNMPLNINGITVSALFTEKDGHIRVSLRSANGFSVNRFSRKYFNGAGHERAAGGKLFIPVGEVGEYFEKCLALEQDSLSKAQDL
jgi:bifunctional oligoribonuclease and PAP phosphatase NrnA